MEGYNRLEAFDFETDDWGTFQERLEQLFEVNGHAGTGADDLVRQRGILLNVCSRKSYDLLRTLSAPKKPKEKSYAELCTLLSSRCSKKPSLIMRRFKFHSRNRHQNESIADYVQALRNLAAECEFSTDVKEHRDRFVCGISNVDMQSEMLEESALDFEKAITIATTTEATENM